MKDRIEELVELGRKCGLSMEAKAELKALVKARLWS